MSQFEQFLRSFVEARLAPAGKLASHGRLEVFLENLQVDGEGAGTARLLFVLHTDESHSSIDDSHDCEVLLIRAHADSKRASELALLGARLRVFATLLSRVDVDVRIEGFGQLYSRCWPHVDASLVFSSEDAAAAFLLDPETSDRSELGADICEILDDLDIPIRSFLDLRRRAVRLVDIEPLGDAEDASPQTRLGGLPDAPPDFAWPLEESGRPMQFVAQLVLGDLPGLGPEELPRHGLLSFFIGRRTDECRVMHFAEVGTYQRKEPPTWRAPRGPQGEAVLPSLAVTLQASPLEWPRSSSERYPQLSRRILTPEERDRLSGYLWDCDQRTRDEQDARPTSVLGYSDLFGVETAAERVLLEVHPAPGDHELLEEELCACFTIPDAALAARQWSAVRMKRVALCR